MLKFSKNNQYGAMLRNQNFFQEQKSVLMFLCANAGTACTPWQHESINHVTVAS